MTSAFQCAFRDQVRTSTMAADQRPPILAISFALGSHLLLSRSSRLPDS